MRVRMLVYMRGPGIDLSPDDEADLPDDEALRLIDREFAVPVPAKIERAVKKPAERRG